MAKKSKKYIEALNQIEKGKAYTKEEAVELVKKVSTSKFDGSVEVAMKLNLDTRKSDQQLRGAIVLPNGTGKTKRILVLSKTNQAQIAKEAGADFVGDADLVEKIEKENLNEYYSEEKRTEENAGIVWIMLSIAGAVIVLMILGKKMTAKKKKDPSTRTRK